jgi:hypothetical protein
VTWAKGNGQYFSADRSRLPIPISADGTWSDVVKLGRTLNNDGVTPDPSDDTDYPVYAVILRGNTARRYLQQLSAGTPSASTDFLGQLSRTRQTAPNVDPLRPGGDIEAVATVTLTRNSARPNSTC